MLIILKISINIKNQKIGELKMKKLSILLISSMLHLNMQSVVWQDKSGNIHSTKEVGQPIALNSPDSNVVYTDKTGQLHNPGFHRPTGTISNFGSKVHPIIGTQIRKLQDKINYESNKVNQHLQAGNLLKVQEHAKKLKDTSIQLHDITKSVNKDNNMVNILPANELDKMHILPIEENKSKNVSTEDFHKTLVDILNKKIINNK